MTRIVTTHHRYKRPPRKRKAVPLAGPSVVRSSQASKPAPPAPTSDDRKSVIVTAKRRRSRFGDVPDVTPEEHRQRGDAADALFRDIVRQATAKD
jgi:hypothetical protein